MARPTRPRAFSAARDHADWLRLVDVSGPFFSLPVLTRAFPQGLPKEEGVSDLRRRLRVELDGWEDEGRRDPGVHGSFVRFVLSDILGWPEHLVKQGQALPPGLDATIAEHGEKLRPDLVAVEPPGRPKAGRGRVLVLVFPPGQDLDRSLEGKRWKASPATRAMELCHATEVPLALVTNGVDWTLVHARRGETTTYATFNAPLFLEEAGLFAAFRALLGEQRLFGVADADTTEALLAESAANQQEVTDQLGAQVRHAVEVLVQAIDRADRSARGAVLRGVDERTLYEGAVAVMMRLVFLLAAEERKLLLLGDPLYDSNYAISTLLPQLEEVATKHGEEVLERRFAAWARLLASFRAVHGGVEHDRFRLPAYGGTLFDPDRFPFLEGRATGTRWRDVPAAPIQVSDRTVYHLLRLLQVLEMGMPGGGREARRLSFRALDVEQIGHVYEGLLDHTAVRAPEPVLGLEGAKGVEPEIPLSAIVMAHDRGEDDLVAFLEEETGRSGKTLRKLVSEASEADIEATSRLLQACANDEKLRDVVKPYASLLRLDSSDYPLVIHKGSVYVTAGADRRSTGTHYTPRSLTEPVVQYALEPQAYRGPSEGWPREKWQLKSARELLSLRICDMAMGSGAFLAQACRWLGDRLVEAWEEAEANAGGKLVVTPEGDLATGAPGERPIPRTAEERITLARRAVAEKCLYGVDVNPMAVEIAKLSLWLVTLQKDRPFTFVDHALRCGDSLLGVTAPEQIACFHVDPEKGRAIHQNLFAWTSACEPALQAALEKRRRLESFTVESAADAEEKQRLLGEANAALADVRLVADAVVAAALATSDVGEDSYAAELERLAPIVGAALDPKSKPSSRAGAREQLAARVQQLMSNGKPRSAARRRPLHWALEFPEVFGGTSAARGFDALVGNPPFVEARAIARLLGADYRSHLVNRVAFGRRGTADLCCYFFLRVDTVLRTGGTYGLIGTNTIAQGDSREVGLDQLLARGVTFYRATSSRPWPGTAALEISEVWGRRGEWRGAVTADGVSVKVIGGTLHGADHASKQPFRLASNMGLALQGSIPFGDGFVLNEQEMLHLASRDRFAREVLRPYMNGDDLNSSQFQQPSRWVIFFGDMPLSREDAEKGYKGRCASDYPSCLERVRQTVLPERKSKSKEVAAAPWWQFWRSRVELYDRLSISPFALGTARVSKYLSFVPVSADWVFSDTVVVFPAATRKLQAVLQSSLHEAWVRRYQSTLETRGRYTPTDCLETFPLPGGSSNGLEAAAERFDATRHAVHKSKVVGLTDFWNAFHTEELDSSDVAEARAALVALDEAALRAYGWGDVALDHAFRETKLGTRFAISAAARGEILSRLLELNHERYSDEVKLGLHETGTGNRKGKPKGNGSRKPTGSGGQGTLF
ncbi:Eco57I restriction-modification methylase domain-containing protein [Anaeromyxobacter oryzisoli]|uniref:Eco57I restriction-modification methylase domain-containing protein n=1 Tax=Anaeromyxobacter oryzisoli TaxID=2925408 RepID=UPI001F599309|nr:type IIL restriction-modification enzyme MmeI [Anaeromyxobacter sp. SG63]